MIKSSRCFLLIFLLIIMSCSTTPIPHSGPAVIPEDFFGLVHAGDTGTDEEYRIIDEFGAVWLLQTFYWGRVESIQGQFDYSLYDNFVNSAKKNNKKIVAVMAYGRLGDRNRYISKENIPQFLNYLEITVNRYKDKVDVWQIWNEPNFVFWTGSDREFFELAKLSAQKIRETDPDAFIIGAGFWRTPKSFIRNMFKTGAFENLNAISFHPYALNPIASMKLYDDFINLMEELNYTGEIWITEIGYATGGIFVLKVAMKKFPSYVIKTIAGAASRGARTLLWYHFSDRYIEGTYPNNINSAMFYGLKYSDNTKKNGAWAYILCTRYLPGSQYNGELPIRDNISSNIVSFCFMEGITGNNVLIIWNDKNNIQKIKVTLGSSFSFHDISTGEADILPDEAVLDISNIPVFITWEGSSAPLISGF